MPSVAHRRNDFAQKGRFKERQKLHAFHSHDRVEGSYGEGAEHSVFWDPFHLIQYLPSNKFHFSINITAETWTMKDYVEVHRGHNLLVPINTRR